MKFTRLYTGQDQQSHFEELELKLLDSEYGQLTDPIHTENIVFGELGELREISWHNPSCSEYVIMLKGSIEIEVGNGTKKIFNEGDIILAEDTTGQGHVTRAASEGVRRYLIMPLKKN